MPLKLGEVRLRKRDAELDDVVSGSGRRLGPTARCGDALLELVRAVLGRNGNDHSGKGDREPDGERPHADEDSGREARGWGDRTGWGGVFMHGGTSDRPLGMADGSSAGDFAMSPSGLL